MGINFEDFLREKHAEDYHGTDDDMPDAFDNWEPDLNDVYEWAEDFASQKYTEGYKAGLEDAK